VDQSCTPRCKWDIRLLILLTIRSRQKEYYPAVSQWGYKSMNCGYGYTSGWDGRCSALDWWGNSLGCYETTIIQRLSSHPVDYGEKLTCVPETTEILQQYCSASTLHMTSK